MAKIPVGPTIASAYRFLFAEIGTIVGIAWVPAVLTAGAGYVARAYAADHKALVEAGDTQTVGFYFLLSLLSMVVTLYASSIVAVAITRQAMGHQRPPGVLLLYFAAGRSEWRMFAANVRYVFGAGVLLALAIGLSALAFVLAGTPLNAAQQMTTNPATLLAGLVTWAVLIYAFITIARMGFLLAPTVVAEDKGGLRRSHELTKGNVWRVIVIVLALVLPILILMMAGEGVVLRAAIGPDFLRMAPEQFFDKAGEAMEQKLIPWQIFSAVIFILGSGILYGGAAFAYRALMEGREGRPLPPQ